MALDGDIQLLTQIRDKVAPFRTFDYDGVKYKRKASGSLISKLNLELEKINNDLKRNDEGIFNHFMKLEKSAKKEPKLESLYKEFLAYDNGFIEKSELVNSISEALDFIHYSRSVEEVKKGFKEAEKHERKLKYEIEILLKDEMLEEEIQGEIYENFASYISQDWAYFGISSYYENNLNILYKAIKNYSFTIGKKYFILKKNVLDYQIALLK